MKYASYLIGSIIDIVNEDKNKYILVGNDPSNVYTMVKLIYDEKTLVLDCEYSEIDISKLKKGDTIVAFHSNAMTLSIPPQTAAFIIEVK